MPPIPQEIITQYETKDTDLALFISNYDESLGKVLVVGAHDEESANMLSAMGNQVTGIDLRSYDENLQPCLYNYIQGDFCTLPITEKYDTFVSISTIEHFGYASYGEKVRNRFYDVIAMRKAWECLREGGAVYLTVPFGKNFKEFPPHWRIYNMESISDRLKQSFQIEKMSFCISGPVVIEGQKREVGDVLGEEVFNYDGDDPHISVLIKMRKNAN